MISLIREYQQTWSSLPLISHKTNNRFWSELMVHISIHRSILYQVIQSHLKLGCFISPFQGVFRDLQGKIFPTELQLLPDTKISKSKALRELNSTQTSTERGLQRWEQAGIFVGEIYRKSNMDNEMRCDCWHHWGCPRYIDGFLSWIWQTEWEWTGTSKQKINWWKTPRKVTQPLSLRKTLSKALKSDDKSFANMFACAKPCCILKDRYTLIRKTKYDKICKCHQSSSWSLVQVWHNYPTECVEGPLGFRFGCPQRVPTISSCTGFWLSRYYLKAVWKSSSIMEDWSSFCKKAQRRLKVTKRY